MCVVPNQMNGQTGKLLLATQGLAINVCMLHCCEIFDKSADHTEAILF